MYGIRETDLLALWERGCDLDPLDRGLLTVHTLSPDAGSASVADWPLGRRNQVLAQLRCACFGRMLHGWVPCRRCAEKLEFALDGDALAENPPPHEADPIIVNGMTFRLPTTRDLARLAGNPDRAGAALRLAALCRLDVVAEPANPSAIGADWGEADLEAIGQQMAAADPLAEIMLSFDCPSCGATFHECLDLPAFFWAEMESCAVGVLGDVHALASAYGWSEAQILSLSPARRAIFIQMVGG